MVGRIEEAGEDRRRDRGVMSNVSLTVMLNLFQHLL